MRLWVSKNVKSVKTNNRLSEGGSALDPNPVVWGPPFSAVQIAPSESACSSLGEMVKIRTFSPVYYRTSSAIILH